MRKHIPSARRFGRIALVCAMIFIAFGSNELLAQERTDCVNALGRAQDLYNNARFDDTVELLQSCLTKGAFPTDEQQLDVYLLIGRANYANDLVDAAKQALTNLLAVSPEYQPDTGRLPPSFVRLIEEVRAEMALRTPQIVEDPPKKKKGGAMKWILAGVGVAGAGVAAAVLLGGNGGNGGGEVVTPGLPRPPVLPVN